MSGRKRKTPPTVADTIPPPRSGLPSTTSKKLRKTKPGTKPGGGGGGRAPISRVEIEMWFEKLMSFVEGGGWIDIVTESNKKFGQNRLPNNVRAHWKTIVKTKLLQGYN